MTDWRKIDFASIEAYKICAQAGLPILSNELQDAANTQLICFQFSPKVKCIGKFSFSGHLLEFSDTVSYTPWSCFTLFT